MKAIIARRPTAEFRRSSPVASDSILNMSKSNSKHEWNKSSLVKVEEDEEMSESAGK